jgi:raffinose/stachyose/melibiose transport system permease protein
VSTRTARTEGPQALAGPADGRTRKTTRRGSPYASWWWALPSAALVVAIHYVSVGAGSVYAFTDSRGIGDASFVGWDNFVRVFTEPTNRTGLINTLVMAAVYVVISTITGLAFALALNRQLKTRHFLRVVLFAPVVLSPLAVSYVWKFIYQPTGVLNEFLGTVGLSEWQRTWLGDQSTAVAAILVVMIWQNTGLTMVIYLAGLANIPAELEEAASIDGASLRQRFLSITLPMLRPTVAIATTLLLISGLRVFDQVLALTNGGPFGASETLATLVYKQTFVNGQYGYGAALSLVLTVLIVIFAIVQNVVLRKRED